MLREQDLARILDDLPAEMALQDILCLSEKGLGGSEVPHVRLQRLDAFRMSSGLLVAS